MEKLIEAFQEACGKWSLWRIKKISRPEKFRGAAEKIVVYIWPFSFLPVTTIEIKIVDLRMPYLVVRGRRDFPRQVIHFRQPRSSIKVITPRRQFHISVQTQIWAGKEKNRYNLLVSPTS
ncbi:MAG: hypothetical protein Q8N65_01985 [bacterium]|nr:hypothetical protein [bacterium]